MQVGNVSQRAIALLGFGGLILYAAWIGGPYLKSIVIRDAAVTTWISVTSSPISGYTTNPLYPGDRVGADGRLVTINDPRAETTELARARANLDHARARAAAQAQIVEAAQQVVEIRSRSAAAYAATFKSDLDLLIAAASANLAFIGRRLELERAEADRKIALARSGNASQAAVDTINGIITDHQRVLTEIQSTLKRATARRGAADDAVFLLEDGTDAGGAERSLEEARLKLKQAQLESEVANAEIRSAQEVIDAATAAYEKSRTIDVLVPPGALVWSLISAPGAPVQPGAPLLSWVDCRIMLVEVPASDVEIALLRKGARANVVLEGEKSSRAGTVILTRGAAATLGSNDLAALAKGRSPGIGQVLVKLESTSNDLKTCPIGHAAYVDFPDIGLIDIVRARLRL